mgnify:CR=1 FL=1
MERDMTVGSPAKMIINFTLPIFLGNVFQQLYNMADTIIVGKFVGAKALAAVGSTGTIMFLIIGFLTGLTAGFTVPTSQKFGAGDMKAMRKTVGSAVILSAVVSAVMTVISMIGMRSLLKLMNTPDDIFCRDAYAYIMVICGGIFAQVLYNLLAQYFKSSWEQQDTALLSDFGSRAECSSRPGIYHYLSHGCSRGGICHCSIAGSIGASLSCIYYKKRYRFCI